MSTRPKDLHDAGAFEMDDAGLQRATRREYSPPIRQHESPVQPCSFVVRFSGLLNALSPLDPRYSFPIDDQHLYVNGACSDSANSPKAVDLQNVSHRLSCAVLVKIGGGGITVLYYFQTKQTCQYRPVRGSLNRTDQIPSLVK